MSALTSIGSNNIAHQNGGNDIVKYTASTAGQYGVLTFSTHGDQTNGISLEGVNRLVGLATPTTNTQAASKAYVDAQVSAASAGLDAKDSVLCATTGNITLLNPGTIDGVTLVQNARVLVKDQTTASENGIYKAGTGPNFALTRAADMNQNDEVAGAYVFIQEGTTMAGQGWVVTAPRDLPLPTIGSTNITWTQFTGAAAIADGSVTNAMLAGSIANGKLANSGVSFGGVSVSLGGTNATPAFDLSDATNYPTTALSGTITNDQLAGSIADSKLAQITTNDKVAGSAVQLAGSGGLQDDSGLKIAASGVTNSMLAGSIAYGKLSLTGAVLNADLAGSIADSKLAQITTSDKVAGSAVELAGSGGLQDDSGLKIAASGVTNAMLAGSIAYGKLSLTGAVLNADLAGSIANAKLANSAITIAGTETALGGSIDASTIAAATATAFAADAISGDKINGGTIGSVTITSVDINGGAIDDTVIGGTTPAAGTFTQVNCTSDARLKENIRTIEPEEALRVIRESRGVTFRFKTECGGSESAGVVAQEAEKVLPRAVSKQACSRTKLSDRRAVDYQAYTGYLLAACKTLAERVEALEASSKKRKRSRDEKEGGEQKRR